MSEFPEARHTDIDWSAPIEDQSRNPRDVIAHLHSWHLMAIDWCRIGDAGGRPQVPGPGRTWRHLPAINAEIWANYATMPYAEALELLDSSPAKTNSLITSHTQEQLFDKGVYPWTGSTKLGAYFASSTSSHYVWGIKTLKAIRRHA